MTDSGSAATLRPFRFGHQVRPDNLAQCIAEAQRAEELGYDIVTIPDHIGTEMASPLIALTAMAQATSTIRLATFVLNNEMRNPVQLAWEAATLDQISGGRFELGIGAGHTPHEFAATGIELHPARRRKERLAEAVPLIRRLLDGETVSHDGDHYTLTDAAIGSPEQTRLPIMMAGNGDLLLEAAGHHADIVGLNGLGRTQADGQRHTVKFGEEWLDHQVSSVQAASAGRDTPPELNALVQRVTITDDRQAEAADMDSQIETLTAAEALSTPYLALGTHEEIAAQFIAVRARWGVSYFVTRALEDMAPVLAQLHSK